jgi:hypothetical protein
VLCHQYTSLSECKTLYSKDCQVILLADGIENINCMDTKTGPNNPQNCQNLCGVWSNLVDTGKVKLNHQSMHVKPWMYTIDLFCDTIEIYGDMLKNPGLVDSPQSDVIKTLEKIYSFSGHCYHSVQSKFEICLQYAPASDCYTQFIDACKEDINTYCDLSADCQNECQRWRLFQTNLLFNEGDIYISQMEIPESLDGVHKTPVSIYHSTRLFCQAVSVHLPQSEEIRT